MLNKTKLIAQIQQITEQLFVDHTQELKLAEKIWHEISNDPTFPMKVKASNAPWPLPHWQDKLNEVTRIAQKLETYRVVSVDGSQVYPDRHQGTNCFLINIGSVVLSYNCDDKAVRLNSVPYVFAGDEAYEEQQSPTDVVNCRRQELELSAGAILSAALQENINDDAPFVFLCDGSLIFWHLDAKETELRTHYLERYCASLQAMRQHNVLMAGYISVPKSKEVVNLLRLKLCEFTAQGCDAYKAIDHVVDANVANLYLEPFTRSTVFKSNANIAACYPSDVAPHFLYLHVGTEIGRVEVPAWIAHDEQKVDTICQVIVDQSIKGRGYPVAIAEAHEQAVVKGPDREFFYHLITRSALEQKQRISISPKSLKKRGIGI